MKGLTMIIALAAALLAGCGTVKKVGKATTKLVTGGDDPLPESSWNAERTWTQVGTSPPTYSPYNFHGTPSESGEWFRDKRDGKQLYVPKGGVEGIPEGVLRAEAWKATHD
ncbi:MAG: hypothetical protein VCA38_01410 [Roseibacillus sp.]